MSKTKINSFYKGKIMSKKLTDTSKDNYKKVTIFLGKLVSFNSALKLYHWHVIGKASYAQHIAIDQALDDLVGYNDSIAEICYAIFGTVDIVIPETKRPEQIIDFVRAQIDFVEENRALFAEVFIQSMLDDFQKTLEQLMFRLKRLS